MPNPFVNDWAGTQPVDILALGPTQLTKLAKKFEQFAGDPLGRFFPAEYTTNRTIVIEREIMDLGFAPLVNPGQPDALQPSRRVERMSVFPVFVRESDFIPMDVINDLRAPGTLNEQNGVRVVMDRMQQLVNRQSMLWALLRAQCILGAINYTDPRTGMSINVNTAIPATNLVDVKNQAGFGGAYWTDANPDIVNDVIKMKRRMANLSKTPPTSMIMTSDLKTALEMSPAIQKYLAGAAGLGGAGNVTGHVTWENGELKAIAGLKIETFDMIVDDSALTGTGGRIIAQLGGYSAANPAGVTRRKIWPQNKIVLVAEKHQLQPGITLGRTQYAPGEAPDGKPGLWSRSGPDTTPPQAPGRSVQIGNCGLPYVMYPDWIGIMTISASPDDVETAAGGYTDIVYP